MKKISIEALFDPFFTADGLRQLANTIEGRDFEEEGFSLKEGVELNGDHYVAEVKEIDC